MVKKEDLFSEGLIITNMDKTDKGSVLKALYEKLYMEGYVKESFLENVLNREERFPTGLVMGEYNIAIPHTESVHVIRSGIAIGLMKDLVPFMRMDQQNESIGIKVVIMMALKGAHDHVEMLSEIIHMFQNDNVLKSLAKSKNSKEAIDIIKQNL